MSASAQPIAYTDADVASLLHVSKRTVYRLRKSGALRAVRIGRSVRTPAEALTEFLERAAGQDGRASAGASGSEVTEG